MVWVRCPLTTANKIATATQMKIGWALVRVELLDNRPLQCYKCLEGGHVRQRCPNKIDRSDRCYRCGESGHTARKCEAALKCPVCSDKNLPSNHRTGGRACIPVQKGKRGTPLDKVIGTSRREKERRDEEASLPLKSGEASTSQKRKEKEGSKGTSLPPEDGEVPTLPNKIGRIQENTNKKEAGTQQRREIVEKPPKEQRMPKIRERRKQEEKFPEGGNKKRRLKESLEKEGSSCMETEEENVEDDPINININIDG